MLGAEAKKLSDNQKVTQTGFYPVFGRQYVFLEAKVTRIVKRDKNLLPGIPAKPKNLSPMASLAWDRLADELAASGIQVTSAHRSAMSLAATISADMADAWAAIQRDGAYIVGKTGMVAHPASKRLDALRRDRIKVLAMLGIRAAVSTPDHTQEQSLEEMLAE